MLKQKELKQGFTLIELLIVIAIIAILAGAVFVLLDPLTRFRDARDSTRAADVTQILSAIKLYQVDNGGIPLSEISSLDDGEVYMIVNGSAMTTGGDDNNANCDTDVDTNTADTVDLSQLITDGYLGEIPVSPNGAVTWDDGSSSGDEGTGYTLEYSLSTGAVTVRACESENTDEIISVR
jgi:prepilin-type N-terminal cleavage/methylation domain-containing protein